MKIDIAKFIDHTLLRADAKASDIARLCREAKEKKTGALIFDEDIPHIRDFPLTFLSLGSRSADEEARNLFARLRQTDACGCDVFYARLPDPFELPDGFGTAFAVCGRAYAGRTATGDV